MAKLTKPQLELLIDLGNGPQSVALPYKPAEKLIALGYTTVVESAFGGAVLYITPAGRRALAKNVEG